MHISKTGLVCALSAALGLSSVAVHAAEKPGDVLKREAAGPLDRPGGARRIAGDMAPDYERLVRSGKVKRVILLIGDGMGDSEITAARNYARGAGGYFPGIDALPVTGQYTHYSLDRNTGKPVYVTDSAASATAWASGVKSYNGAIGVDIRGTAVPTLLELAQKAGMATGVVTTSNIQDATPAAQLAHVPHRGCAGPDRTATLCPSSTLEAGGLGSISEQILARRADVVLGGGASTFAEIARAGDWKGKTLSDQAAARGFAVVRDAAQLEAVRAADTKRPLLGLFAEGNMPVRWLGPKAIPNGSTDAPAFACTANPERTGDLPTLAAMTRKAIELLDRNPQGFFLQVEGASIDKSAHAANPCGQIGETVDLDEAVQVALAFAREHDDTLVIVTADHAHSTQIIGTKTRSPGLSAALITADGAVMAVHYGTTEEGAQDHTGTQLRIAAYGPWSANVAGLTDQTDLFFTIRDALDLDGALAD